jgi:hypothetical protein
VTENPDTVGGYEHTGAFDSVVGVPVDVWFAFDIVGESRSIGPLSGYPQLDETTGPVHVTFRGGPDDPLRTRIQPSLEGQTTTLSLIYQVGRDIVSLDNFVVRGAAAAEYFGFTVGSFETALGHGADGYPVLGPIAPTATMLNFGRFQTATPEVTDTASGYGTLALD